MCSGTLTYPENIIQHLGKVPLDKIKIGKKSKSHTAQGYSYRTGVPHLTVGKGVDIVTILCQVYFS